MYYWAHTVDGHEGYARATAQRAAGLPLRTADRRNFSQGVPTHCNWGVGWLHGMVGAIDKANRGTWRGACSLRGKNCESDTRDRPPLARKQGSTIAVLLGQVQHAVQSTPPTGSMHATPRVCTRGRSQLLP